ncbi:transcription antitermination factor NusB [Actinomycetales bacterium UMB0918]|nr:transcription antitermination factor NusB [Actinomyces sp. UMB0918]
MSRKKNRKFTGRTKARSRAVDTLFEADQRGFGSTPERIKDLARARQVVSTAQTGIPPYAYQIVLGVADHVNEIDEAISANATNWTLDRMPGVDLAILRVGAWEIMFNDEIDGPVAIKEAMAISEVIASDKTPAFVNAILDRIMKVSKARQAVFGSATVPEDFAEGVDLPAKETLPEGSVVVPVEEAGSDQEDNAGEAGTEDADTAELSDAAGEDAVEAAKAPTDKVEVPSEEPDQSVRAEEATEADAPPRPGADSVAQALANLAAGDFLEDEEEE